jgi:hypothetical protein
MINTKLQSIIDTKSAIGNAIVNKGGTITGETPFFNYAAQIDGISTGTPQTIFQASDGSKWALTNAVNLVNDAGNVTHDFNYWQPANNSTSDPILNIGTVGANISGNIQLVPVNQVNIAQFENIVINDTTGAKYVGYNGYDSITNPTPTGNTTFNQWLLNNSASGTVLFANTVITNGGTFNGANTTINQASMPFVNNTASFGGNIRALTTNNGFIYVGGFTNDTIQKYYESNLAFVGNTPVYNGFIWTLAINNSFIYVAGFGPGFGPGEIKKYHEGNLAVVNQTGNFGNSAIYSIKVNNNFVYIGGGFGAPGRIGKYHESNLVFVENSVNYGGIVEEIIINNGFIYAAGDTDQRVKKFYESNLVFVNNSANYGAKIVSMAINNGFLYVGGSALTGTNRGVSKFYEDNLALVSNTVNFGGEIRTLATNNGFIYAGGLTNQTVQKFREDNLAFVGNTASYGGDIFSLTTNNGFIYAGGATNQTVQKFEQQSVTAELLTFYTATKIKE